MMPFRVTTSQYSQGLGYHCFKKYQFRIADSLDFLICGLLAFRVIPKKGCMIPRTYRSCFFVICLTAAVTATCLGSEISIISPRDGQEVKGLTVDLAFRLGPAFGSTQPEVRFQVNGEDVPTKRGMKVVGDSSTPQQESISIPGKNCEIVILAKAQDGTEHKASVRVVYNGKAQEASSRLYVLAVGISDYIDERLKLKLAAKDAEDFAEAILRQRGNLYSDVIVSKLTNREATREKIMDGLNWLAQSATQHDRAMLFMAGHGDNDRGSFFFLPADANVSRIMATCVRWTDIKDTISSMACQTVVFLDACHSGGVMGGRRSVPRDMTSVLADWQTADGSAGSAMFSSSTGKQYSQEREEWGNGAFTKALLEGLSGKAIEEPYGPVTLKKLDAFVSERVKEITEGEQSPTTSYTPDLPDIPLAFAGDITAFQAQQKEEQQLENAKEQAATSINAAFRASQKIFHARAKIEKLQALNSDGFANDAIAELQKQVSDQQSVLDQNVAALNQLAGGGTSIAVAQALLAREAQLRKDLETVAADKTGEVAQIAFQTLKQQINLPEHH
ncbi:MAG: hypothetical protein RIQ71_1070 [Verrucomicrobiota bacterium]|jgi:uncharacterized caspase-like protein